jgi:hemoglobin-like flavoprotein
MDTDIETQRTEDARLLRESLTLIAPVAEQLIASFYERLFAEYPQVRSLFPANMDMQREKLLKAVIALVTHYDTPEALLPALTTMGRNHVRYGAQVEHYGAVGQTLLTTLESYAGDAWTPELAGAWERAYTFAAGTMMRAATAEVGLETAADRQAAA